jgi:small subunit ribosomal protein S13
MPRLLGVDIPANKKLEYSLRYIYGIGPKRAKDIVAISGFDPDRRAGDSQKSETRHSEGDSIWKLRRIQ